MYPKKMILAALAAFSLMSAGCFKSEEKEMEENCELIQKVKITGAKESYKVGDTISLKMNVEPHIYEAYWIGGGMLNYESGKDFTIYNCTKNDEGWYYLAVAYQDCKTKNDSVYISVTSKAVAAPCTPVENKIDYNGIPDIWLSSVTWGGNTSYWLSELHGASSYGYPEIGICFDSYWNNKDPEDGEYTVTSLTSLSNPNPYEVYVYTLYSGVQFNANAGKVYVSHVNGKIKAQFCEISFTGSNGQNTFKVTAQGSITAP